MKLLFLILLALFSVYAELIPSTYVNRTIAGMSRHTCILVSNGSSICWGDNGFGQLGINGALVTDGPFKQIGCSDSSTCGLLVSGSVKCWGWNGWGTAPSFVAGPFIQISCGKSHTCGLLTNGDANCWGNNNYGDSPSFVAGPFIQVESGDSHSCGLYKNNTVTCWGTNSVGQLGYSGSTSSLVNGPFTQISCGAQHVCGILLNGSLSCWGKNDDGRAPLYVSGNFIQVDCGQETTCVISSDKNVRCFGSNVHGDIPSPIIGPFSQIVCSVYYTCLRYVNNTIKCLGDNSYGQSIIPQGYVNLIKNDTLLSLYDSSSSTGASSYITSLSTGTAGYSMSSSTGASNLTIESTLQIHSFVLHRSEALILTTSIVSGGTTYIVNNPLHIEFLVDGSISMTFTQQQLENKLVRVIHDGSYSMPFFSLFSAGHSVSAPIKFIGVISITNDSNMLACGVIMNGTTICVDFLLMFPGMDYDKYFNTL